MKLEYQISENDFMSAHEAFWSSRKQGSKRELIWGAIGVVAGVVILVTSQPIGWALVIAGAILASMIPLRSFLHRSSYRKNPSFSGVTAVRFREEDIEVTNPVGESRLEWSFYQSALESEQYFMPMITNRTFSIIPKRAFGSDEELSSFRSLLESKVGNIQRI